MGIQCGHCGANVPNVDLRLARDVVKGAPSRTAEFRDQPEALALEVGKLIALKLENEAIAAQEAAREAAERERIEFERVRAQEIAIQEATERRLAARVAKFDARPRYQKWIIAHRRLLAVTVCVCVLAGAVSASAIRSQRAKAALAAAEAASERDASQKEAARQVGEIALFLGKAEGTVARFCTAATAVMNAKGAVGISAAAQQSDLAATKDEIVQQSIAGSALNIDSSLLGGSKSLAQFQSVMSGLEAAKAAADSILGTSKEVDPVMASKVQEAVGALCK